MITVQASIAGGAWSSGGITASLSNTLDLRLADYTGVSSIRWELLDFPPAFTVPTGWSTAADGTFYSTASTPAQFVMDEWGKYMVRCIVNGGLKTQADGSVVEDPSLIDEATCVRILSPRSVDDMGITERTQWYSREGWAGGFKAALRTIDTWMSGVITWDPLGFVRRALGSPPATPAAGNVGVYCRGADDAHARLAYISAAGTVRDCIASDGSVPLTAAWDVGSYGITAESLTADTGNIAATAGSVSAGTTLTAGTGVTATTGNIAASSGNVSASGTVTGGTGVTATTGDVTATAGKVKAGTDMEATSGKFVALGSTHPCLYQGSVLIQQCFVGTGSISDKPARSQISCYAQTTDSTTWTTVATYTFPNSHNYGMLFGWASQLNSPYSFFEIKCGFNGSGPVGTIYYGGAGSASNIQFLVSSGVVSLQIKGTASATHGWLAAIDEKSGCHI